MSPSSLIISLDFEQYWGVYHLFTQAEYATRLRGGRLAIPAILERFERAGVAATWATVGLLMCEGRTDALKHLAKFPHYPQFRRQVASVIESSGDSEEASPGLYAPSLVRRIIATNRQELATHTFSHFHCLEAGPSLGDFEADLEAAQSAAMRLGASLKSIVLPRNQYSRAHLRVCARLGFQAFRGNPPATPYSLKNNVGASSRVRGLRFLDAYLPVVSSRQLLSRPVREEGMVNVPASRFLRPIRPIERPFARLRLRRICYEMTLAAQQGGSYHLWWHPYNFAVETGAQLALLDELLAHFEHLQGRYGMRSLSMIEAADEFALT